MRVALEIAAVAGVVTAVGCTSSGAGRPSGPVVTILPNDWVMRDVRKDAARHMRCQVPMVRARIGPWAGSEGNVIAFGCGYRINYFLRCATNNMCTFTIN